MTTKLKFIESACSLFACTHSVVLAAVAGQETKHPDIVKQIKAFAEACQAGSVGDKFLWSITTGAEIDLT